MRVSAPIRCLWTLERVIYACNWIRPPGSSGSSRLIWPASAYCPTTGTTGRSKRTLGACVRPTGKWRICCDGPSVRAISVGTKIATWATGLIQKLYGTTNNADTNRETRTRDARGAQSKDSANETPRVVLIGPFRGGADGGGALRIRRLCSKRWRGRAFWRRDSRHAAGGAATDNSWNSALWRP